MELVNPAATAATTSEPSIRMRVQRRCWDKVLAEPTILVFSRNGAMHHAIGIKSVGNPRMSIDIQTKTPRLGSDRARYKGPSKAFQGAFVRAGYRSSLRSGACGPVTAVRRSIKRAELNAEPRIGLMSQWRAP
jgi:hypothetical protein